MEKSIQKIYNKIGVKSLRTKNITKHVLLSFFYKGGSILANFLLVPITINYLNTENYGIWLTISSFVSWFSFFDIGLGNGLRNKLSEAKAKGAIRLAKGYVSTAYFTIGIVCLILIFSFTVINTFIDWTKVFNTSHSLKKDLEILMPIVFGFFCLQLVVKLITTIYTADQHHSTQGKINFITQVGSLILIWIMTLTTRSSLLIFGTIFSIFPVFILLIFSFLAFNSRYADLKPSMALWQTKYFKDIFGLGFTFFIVQISGIILFTTDNIIISKLFSPAEVVPYNISYKYFGISIMIFNILASPFWSSITEAYHNNDLDWIKTSMKNFKKLSYFFIAALLVMFLVSEFIYKFWIGTSTHIDNSLNLFTSLHYAIILIATPYTIFLNGIGKIKLQAIQGLMVAIINIPISIWFTHVFNLGVTGIILGTNICLIPTIILSIIQYKKIISKSALGIWNA